MSRRVIALGAVTGFRAEAACLRGLDVRVACSGGRPAQARQATETMVREGARALLSFGLAGGLVTELHPGDLLLPEVVLSPERGRLPIDATWRQRMHRLLEDGGLAPQSGMLAGSHRLVATPAAKRALSEATGAVAVDMESHVLAEVAAAAGLPFLVLRAIADPSDQAIPVTARDALAPDGRIRVGAVLRGLVHHPDELLPLLRLGRHSAKGLATLRRAVLLGDSRLGLEHAR